MNAVLTFEELRLRIGGDEILRGVNLKLEAGKIKSWRDYFDIGTYQRAMS